MTNIIPKGNNVNKISKKLKNDKHLKTLKTLKTLKKQKHNTYKKGRKGYKRQTGGETLLFRVGGKNTTIEYENDKDFRSQIESVMSQFRRPYQKTEYKAAVTYALKESGRSEEDIDRIFSNQEALTQSPHHAASVKGNGNAPSPPLPPRNRQYVYVIDMDLIFSKVFDNICPSKYNEGQCKIKIEGETKVIEQNQQTIVDAQKRLEAGFKNRELIELVLGEKFEKGKLARFIDLYFVTKEDYDYLVAILSSFFSSVEPKPYVFFISYKINLAILKMMLTSVDEFNRQICVHLLRGDDLKHIKDGKITDDGNNFSYLDKYFLVPEALKNYKADVTQYNYSNQLQEAITQSFSTIFGTTQSRGTKTINIVIVSKTKTTEGDEFYSSFFSGLEIINENNVKIYKPSEDVQPSKYKYKYISFMEKLSKYLNISQA